MPPLLKPKKKKKKKCVGIQKCVGLPPPPPPLAKLFFPLQFRTPKYTLKNKRVNQHLKGPRSDSVFKVLHLPYYPAGAKSSGIKGEYNILKTLSLLGPFQVLIYPLFLRVYELMCIQPIKRPRVLICIQPIHRG